MVLQHVSVQQAYAIFDLDEARTLQPTQELSTEISLQHAGVDELKSAYKKAALTTHPDRNPDDPNATARFQEVGAAYDTLLKHLECPSPYSSDSGGYYDVANAENLDYFRDILASVLRGEQYMFAYFAQERHRHHSPESEEEHQERLRKQREDRKLAAERDVREREARKQRIREQQEQDKLKAEHRRKEQAIQKKAKDEEIRRSKERAVRDQKVQAQRLRSAVFSAARKGEAEKVKKGVWEDNVDAAGGEVKSGSEEFLNPEDLPQDPQETLLHIAASKGNKELAEWLINHNAEPDEKDSKGLTAFHVALKAGYTHVVNYFISSLPSSQEEYEPIYAHPPSTNNLRLAMETADPELVWTVLEHKLAKSRQISDGWSWFCSADGEETLRRKMRKRWLGDVEVEGKMEEIRNLLTAYGKFTPPPTPKIGVENINIPYDGNNKHKNKKPAVDSPAVSSPPPSILQNPTPSASPAPSDHSSSPHHNLGSPSPSHSHTHNSGSDQRTFLYGRGRGRGRARGRGRGRGGLAQPTPAPVY